MNSFCAARDSRAHLARRERFGCAPSTSLRRPFAVIRTHLFGWKILPVLSKSFRVQELTGLQFLPSPSERSSVLCFGEV
jgi:hypothetical protein